MSRAALLRPRGPGLPGTHVTRPLVDAYRAATVEPAGGITCYADGGRCLPLPVTVTCVPGALRVLGSSPASRH